MPKDKKKKRKDKRKKGPGLQSYRPGAGLSQQDLLLSLIGRMGSGYGGGHVSVQVPNYSGMGGTGQNSAIMDELGRLGGLVNSLISDSKKSAPLPETRATATFGIQTEEPEEEIPATTTQLPPVPSPFVFGDPASILSQVVTPQPRRPLRPTRASRRHQNQLFAQATGAPVSADTDPNPPIVDMEIEEIVPPPEPPRSTTPDIAPPGSQRSTTPDLPPPPLTAAPPSSINQPSPHNVTVEDVDDEEEPVIMEDTPGVRLLHSGEHGVDPPRSTTPDTAPPEPPAETPADAPPELAPPSPPTETPAATEPPPAETPPTPEPPAAEDPPSPPSEEQTIEQKIRDLEAQIASARELAEEARKAYEDHQKKTEVYNNELAAIMANNLIDGKEKRDKIKQLRTRIYGTSAKIGVDLEKAAVGAEDDVRFKEALLKRLLRQKETAERNAEDLDRTLSDAIQKLRERLAEIGKTRQLDDGQAAASADQTDPPPTRRRPAPDVTVEDVDEAPPQRRRRQDDPGEVVIDGIPALPPTETMARETPIVLPDAAAFEEETNQSANSLLVPFVERPTRAPVIRQQEEEGLFGTVVRGRKRSARQAEGALKSPAVVTRDILQEDTIPTLSPVVRQMMHQNSNSLLNSIIYSNALPPLRQPMPPFIQRDDYALIPLRPEYEDEDL